MIPTHLHILHPARSIATWRLLADHFGAEARAATTQEARREAERQQRAAWEWISWQEARL